MPASTPRWSTPSIVAPWPSRRPTLGLAAAIVASVLSGAAMADPLIHNSSMTGPAMPGQTKPSGMLRAPSAAPYAVYAAGYGIDRGTCDRHLIARDMAKRQITDLVAMATADTLSAPMKGGALTRDMDPIDLGCVGRVLEYAPDRQIIRWYGADRIDRNGIGQDGPAYALTPLATFERNGQFCRDYRAIASRDGKDQQSYGTACRRADGLWQASE
ncbi:hypothetical protein [Ferrovibrio sp.]|jgi:surface antigen|uniref:hypothetical protein n=1 Tax=Ferrovibrio sp. TaxID=1917215 RepID=UPI0035AEF88A